MKRGLLGAVAAGAAIIGVAAPTAAAPPGLEERFGELEFDCEGDTVFVVAANGRMGWIGNDKYQLRTIDVESTFTPTGGGDPEVFSFSKSYGNGPKSATTISCEATFTFDVPAGSVSDHVEIVAVQI